MHDQPQKLTNSFLIGNVVVPAPAYIPEIKGPEDIETLLRYSKIMPVGNPVMFPSNRWSAEVAKPLFRKGNLLKGILPIEQFLRNHSIIFYDPPEFFRYTLGKQLITYALKGSISEARSFNKNIRDGKFEEAISKVPPFFQPFVERQLSTICSDLDAPYNHSKSRNSHLEEAWFDSRVDESYVSYISSIAGDALKIPNATIIPPVPPLMKSSGKPTISRILGSNALTSLTCLSLSKGEEKMVVPYFHLYVDWNTIELREGNDISTVVDILQEGLKKWAFSGVAVTINGYENAAKSGKINQLGQLINEIVNISHENNLPVILPRSKWYGLYFTDIDIQAFSSMLNGNLIYRKGGGMGNPEDKFGKVPLIDKCVELKLNEVRKHIETYGEFPSVSGLPRKPSPDYYQSDKAYRVNWSKPMRLIHIEEARRIRDAKKKSILSPAKLYLSRSSNHELNAL